MIRWNWPHTILGKITRLLTTLVALFGWVRLMPGQRIPFSKLVGRGHVGADFFQCIGAVADVDKLPCGLMDELAEYRRADFVPEEIHPAIRSFYEQTANYNLLVRANWKFGFRLAARVYKWCSSRMEQLNFPLMAERHEDLMDSRILPISDAVDGRRNVRAWVRTYSKTGTAMYVAAYSTHKLGQQTYMNIAFPLLGGNLTCVLRIESVSMTEGAKGILLTTFQPTGDEGLYFVNRILPVRLPMSETIRVWAVGMEDRAVDGGICWLSEAMLAARHDMWLLGIKYLTLDYAIFPKLPKPTTSFFSNA